MAAEYESGFLVVNEEAGNTVSWHGLESPVEYALDRHEAIREAGLDWTVDTRPVMYENPETCNLEEVKGHSVVVREDTGKDLGIVGGRYTPIQNDTMFEVAEAIINADGGARYHAGASLRGGKLVYLLLKQDEQLTPMSEPTEAIDRFLLVTSSHDGSVALTTGLTRVRVVCSNTLNLALGGIEHDVRVRHTASAEKRMEAAQQILGMGGLFDNRLFDFASKSMTNKMERPAMKRLLDHLFPIADDDSDRSKTIAKNRRSEVFSNWLMSDTIENVRYTEWGALNAISEWEQHQRNYRGKTDRERAENRFLASLAQRSVARDAEDLLVAGF